MGILMMVFIAAACLSSPFVILAVFFYGITLPIKLIVQWAGSE